MRTKVILINGNKKETVYFTANSLAWSKIVVEMFGVLEIANLVNKGYSIVTVTRTELTN